MCGRYTYLYTWDRLQLLLGLLSVPPVELTPRYNVAPRQHAPVVRLNGAGQRVGVMLEWGLLPSWSKDPGLSVRPINARGESVFVKPAFRHAAIHQRCLVPTSGFYEWQKNEGEKHKQPYWIGRSDREPLFFAGLWEAWRDPSMLEHAPLESFAIVTTAANPLMAPLHDRMPVILQQADCSKWLDPATPRPALEALIRPYPGDDLVAYPVHSTVNSPRRDDPTLIERAGAKEKQRGLFD